MFGGTNCSEKAARGSGTSREGAVPSEMEFFFMCVQYWCAHLKSVELVRHPLIVLEHEGGDVVHTHVQRVVRGLHPAAPAAPCPPFGVGTLFFHGRRKNSRRAVLLGSSPGSRGLVAVAAIVAAAAAASAAAAVIPARTRLPRRAPLAARARFGRASRRPHEMCRHYLEAVLSLGKGAHGREGFRDGCCFVSCLGIALGERRAAGAGGRGGGS